MTSDASLASRGLLGDPLAATTDPEVQRLLAAVEARLTGEPAAPVRIDRFVVLERVGQGAMGVVYAAYDGELDRKVAIKVLHAGRGDPQVRTRLLREAQAMARLSHPNVVAVYETGDHGGAGFVAMEFVRGRTLRQWQQGDGASLVEILAAYEQAGRGLVAAHGAGVVHRDFKPDNVLVEGDADALRVRVADFGLASVAVVDETGSESPTRVGTPGYMSPEQILGESVDARADQFAFCVALWEALAGARPFAGTTTREVFEAVLAGAITPPPRGVMPRSIEVALRKGLATDPGERHASMRELAAALRWDPRGRRRRRIALGVGLAVVPAIWGVQQARATMAERACAGRAAAIDEVWTPDVSTGIATAFAGTTHANADATAQRVVDGLGAYADTWRDGATAACLAIERDRRLDADAAERALACLDERKQSFETLTGALQDVDAGVVDNAVRSVAQLPAVARCNDARALALDLAPPTDPERRAEVRRLRALVSANEGLRRLGRNAEALAALEAIEPEAAAVEWPALSAGIAFRMAQLQINLGDIEEARVLGNRAFFDAFRAGDDETAAMSAALLSHVNGVVLLKEDEATLWDELAQAAIDRLPAAQADPAISFLGTIRGRRALRAGDTAAAEAALVRALEAGAAVWGPDHVLLSDTLLVLANAQCMREAWRECRATHERAWSILRDAVGEEHPWTARAAAGLGLSLGHDGDPARGLELLDAALRVDERQFGATHYNVATDHAYAGLVLLERGDAEAARVRFESAVAIVRRVFGPSHVEVATQLVNLARAQRAAGLPGASLVSLVEAEGILRASGATAAAMKELEAELDETQAALAGMR